MTAVVFKIEGPGFKHLENIAEMTNSRLNREVSLVINDTAKKHKTAIAKRISQEVAVSQKVVRTIVDIKKSNASALFAVITVYKTKRPSLKEFGARQIKTGVTYRISKRGKRQKIKGAFGPQIDRLGRHVFVRTGPKRFPIKKIMGVSPWAVYVKTNSLAWSETQILDDLELAIHKRVRALVLKEMKRTVRG